MKHRTKIYPLSVFICLICQGCAGLMHNYVSSPKAVGTIEKSMSELCPSRHLASQNQSPSFIQLELQKIALCVESETYKNDPHIVLIGPYIVVPLPIIPMPYGIYKLMFPPKQKNIVQVVNLSLRSKEGDLSFDPRQVTLVKKDKTVLTPRRFECSWSKLDNHGNRREFTNYSGVIPIKMANEGATACSLIIDSYDWDFVFLIRGIDAKGEPVVVPPVHFQRGSNWWGDVAP